MKTTKSRNDNQRKRTKNKKEKEFINSREIKHNQKIKFNPEKMIIFGDGINGLT